MRHTFVAVIVFVVGIVSAAIMGTPIIVNDEEQLLRKARTASDNFEVQEAVALYTKAIESGHLSPQQLANAYLGRGYARTTYALGYGVTDSEALLALHDFQKAIEIKPSSDAYQAEGRAFIALGAYSEATAAYQTSLPLDLPKPHWSLIGLAVVERIQGHYDTAMKYLDRLLEVWGEDNGSMPIYYHRARLFFAMNNFAGVVDAITKGLPYQPDYASAYAYRACAYARLGDAAKAVADMQHSIELSNAAGEDAWSKTPMVASMRKDTDAYLVILKAMAAGGGSESDRLSLCKWTWHDDEQLRERSPLLGSASRELTGGRHTIRL